MTYRLEPEWSRGQRLAWATSPASTILTAMFLGSPVGVAWVVANGHFMRCRDATRQTVIGVVGIFLLMAYSIASVSSASYLAGLHHGNFIYDVLQNIYLGLLLVLVIWLSHRQSMTERYLKEIEILPRYRIGLVVGLCVGGFLLRVEMPDELFLLKVLLFGP